MLMCRDVAEQASDYIDGKLRPMRRASFRMHLLLCRHCRNFVGNLRNSIELLQGHPDQQLDDAYARRLDDEIQRALVEHGYRDVDS